MVERRKVVTQEDAGAIPNIDTLIFFGGAAKDEQLFGMIRLLRFTDDFKQVWQLWMCCEKTSNR
jgi:hypothetical protein